VHAVGLGTNILAGVAGLTLLGYWIDGKRGTGVAWTLSGLALGFAYSIYEIWKAIRLIEREEAERRRTTAAKGAANPAENARRQAWNDAPDG
jgi:hypothetical protein